MRKKHQKVIDAIFSEPVKANILWKDVENMLISLGADLEEAAGSRICIELNGVIAVFHRPHPRKEADKGAVKSLQKFLIEAGVNDARI
jgi:hypothetical protein